MQEVKIIKIDRINPDENQPRRFFDATKMATLKRSVEKYGILTPLVVQAMKDGTFILIDGERRFKTAKALGLKEVPAVVNEAKDEVERLIQQFHIQEQHEGWSPLEKAGAILGLAERTGATVEEICSILGITPRTARNFISFANFADKAAFERSQLPLYWVDDITKFKNSIAKTYAQENDGKMTRGEEKKLENILINKIVEGQIVTVRDLAKIKDSVHKDPDVVNQIFKDTKWTPEKLFRTSKAEGAYYIRNVAANATHLVTNTNKYLANPDVKPTDNQIISIRSASRHLKKLMKYLQIED